jgi:hypothetical protein
MPTPTYIALATTTLVATDAEIVFSSIPATYRDLVLVISGTVSTAQGCFLYLNGDTANGSRVIMYGDGSSAVSGSASDTKVFDMSTTQSNVIAQIFDYAQTDKHKTHLTRSNTPGLTQAAAGRWASTAAVTSVTAKTSTGTFSIGSTFSLYGVA